MDLVKVKTHRVDHLECRFFLRVSMIWVQLYHTDPYGVPHWEAKMIGAGSVRKMYLGEPVALSLDEALSCS